MKHFNLFLINTSLNIDTNVQAIGIQIPQHLTHEMSPKESGYMLIIPQHEPVRTRGRLSAVQLWCLESGATAVMVIIQFLKLKGIDRTGFKCKFNFK